jgi:hypothetical protein
MLAELALILAPTLIGLVLWASWRTSVWSSLRLWTAVPPGPALVEGAPNPALSDAPFGGTSSPPVTITIASAPDAILLWNPPISSIRLDQAAVDPDLVFRGLTAPPSRLGRPGLKVTTPLSGPPPPALQVMAPASAPIPTTAPPDAVAAPPSRPPLLATQVRAPPPGPPEPDIRVDPGTLRKILDRGVVLYATATSDQDRAKGATLIQVAALVGYPPARALLARNYPQSAAVRAVVPADDAIRYGLDFLKDPAAATEDSEKLFLAIEKHFGLEGELDGFAAQILGSLRGDTRPQLSHRLDTLLDLLAKVPGACAAVARQVPGAENLTEAECPTALGSKLRAFIETRAPADLEGAARRRGLLLLNQLDFR